MAALPKKKISKVRGKTRRNHYKVDLVSVTIDKTTGTPRLPHRLAPDTGMYNGRVALKTRLAKKLDRTMAKSARAQKAASATKAPKTAATDKPAKKTSSPAKPKTTTKKLDKKTDSSDK